MSSMQIYASPSRLPSEGSRLDLTVATRTFNSPLGADDPDLAISEFCNLTKCGGPIDSLSDELYRDRLLRGAFIYYHTVLHDRSVEAVISRLDVKERGLGCSLPTAYENVLEFEAFAAERSLYLVDHAATLRRLVAERNLAQLNYERALRKCEEFRVVIVDKLKTMSVIEVNHITSDRLTKSWRRHTGSSALRRGPGSRKSDAVRMELAAFPKGFEFAGSSLRVRGKQQLTPKRRLKRCALHGAESQSSEECSASSPSKCLHTIDAVDESCRDIGNSAVVESSVRSKSSTPLDKNGILSSDGGLLSYLGLCRKSNGSAATSSVSSLSSSREASISPTCSPSKTRDVESGVLSPSIALPLDETAVMNRDPSMTTSNAIVVFDLETTGFLDKDVRVIEIGAVNLETGAVFQSFVRPSAAIPVKDRIISGITDQDLESAPTFSEVWSAFRDFVGNSILLAHNGKAFDVPVLELECSRHGLEPLTNKIIDSLVLFRQEFSHWPQHSLDFIRQLLGIKSAGRTHRALCDSFDLACAVLVSFPGADGANLLARAMPRCMPFGKFKNVPWTKVPVCYKQWVVRSNIPDQYPELADLFRDYNNLAAEHNNNLVS